MRHDHYDFDFSFCLWLRCFGSMVKYIHQPIHTQMFDLSLAQSGSPSKAKSHQHLACCGAPAWDTPTRHLTGGFRKHSCCVALGDGPGPGDGHAWPPRAIFPCDGSASSRRWRKNVNQPSTILSPKHHPQLNHHNFSTKIFEKSATTGTTSRASQSPSPSP